MNDELERLRERCAAYKGQVEAGAAEIGRLRAELRGYAKQIERIAFEIEPPNPHTPELVMVAQAMTRAANEQPTREDC